MAYQARDTKDIVLDLPPWFVNNYGADIRKHDYDKGPLQIAATCASGRLRTFTLDARDHPGGCVMVSPIARDRAAMFREEFLRAPL